MSRYVDEVMTVLSRRLGWETEFLQSVQEVFDSIARIVEDDCVYRTHRILERIVEPERTLSFRVPWRNDRGETEVNTGFRVEFNSAIGPYKGGLRFHPSVNQSILKFLGFEQTFKNALTGLPMGGGKGGADFSAVGKSDSEMMSFCQSFMIELARHIGPNTDVPAGDIGVGTREIGYMFGQYKRIKNSFDGVFTGKGINWGGSLVRPEATGYGLVYFLQEMMKANEEGIEGKRVAISGFGNVAWGAAKKVTELRGRVVTLSGPDGFIHDPDGLDAEKIEFMLKMRRSCNDRVKDFSDRFGAKFFPGCKPWGVKCDVALPCATQNEVEAADVLKMDSVGVRYVAEGANLPLTLEAMRAVGKTKIRYAPGKASNAGGVACSGLEMTQNAVRLTWTAEQVDRELRSIMSGIHRLISRTAEEYDAPGNYVVGANIASFLKVANAMLDQGLV